MNKKYNINTILFDLGARIFAPIMVVNFHWLVETVVNNGYDVVCFGARDGYVVKEVFDRYSNYKNSTKYLLGSRAAYYLAGITEKRNWIYERLFQIPQDQSLACILDRLCLDQSIAEIEKTNINLQTPMAQLLPEHLFYIQEVLLPILSRRARLQRSALIRYWTQLGLCGKKVLFWDSGWNGTQAQIIENILQDTGFPVDMDFGFFHLIKPVSSVNGKHRYISCTGDNKVSQTYYECIYRAIPLLDSFFSAPEPSVIAFSYIDKNPVIFDHIQNTNWKYSAAMQRGALCTLDCSIRYSSIEEALNPLSEFIKLPSEQALIALSMLSCSTAYGTEKYNQPLINTIWKDIP